MLIGIQHLERRQSLGDILSGEFLLAADDDVCRLGVHGLDHAAETNLLEVEDDVLHSLDYSGNGLELVLYAFDLDLADGKTLQRGQQNATESIADGLTVTRLERPEFETADGIGAFEHYNLVGFLKS